jgi:hypothetical protein
VAEIVTHEAERRLIAEILRELGDVADGFFADARAVLSDDEWALLIEYATASARRVLEVGTSLHAVAAAHEETAGRYPGRGRTTFVRAGLRAWRDSYAPIRDVWRIAPVAERVPGGERRVLAEVETLEEMAANRLFNSLDEESRRLFGADA